MYLNVYVYFRSEKQHIKLPRDIEDAKRLGNVLSRYKDKFYIQVLGAYFITYILYPFTYHAKLYIEDYWQNKSQQSPFVHKI